jgi:hypothetical protein
VLTMRTVAGGVVAVLLVAAGCGGDSGGPSVSLRGDGSEAAGDGGVADLVYGLIEVAGSSIKVRVQTSAATFHPDSLLIVFNFDTDGSALTGYTTINPGHVGLGIDCLVELGKPTPGVRNARVQRWASGNFTPTATGNVTVIANGYEATLPLNACPELADGLALFRVEAFRQLSATAYTIRQDWLPDPPGAPLAVR